MAQLNDLIVNGPVRILGTVSADGCNMNIQDITLKYNGTAKSGRLSFGDGDWDRCWISEGSMTTHTIDEDTYTNVFEYNDNDTMVMSGGASFTILGEMSNSIFDGDLIGDYDGALVNVPKGTVSAQRMNTTDGFFVTSDERRKNIHGEIDLDKAYDLIEKCSTIIYDLKDDEEHKIQIGVIAQEIEEFFPEIIQTDKDDNKTLDYSKLTVIIMRVLKDLIDRVKTLENK